MKKSLLITLGILTSFICFGCSNNKKPEYTVNFVGAHFTNTSFIFEENDFRAYVTYIELETNYEISSIDTPPEDACLVNFNDNRIVVTPRKNMNFTITVNTEIPQLCTLTLCAGDKGEISGTHEKSISVEVPYGSLLSLILKNYSAERLGCNFKSWSLVYGFDVKYEDAYIVHDLTLYAFYNGEFTVTWNVDGTIQEQMYQFGEMPYYDEIIPYRNKSEIKEDGSQTAECFIGWDKEFTRVTDNVTYIAQYEERSVVTELKIPGGVAFNNKIELSIVEQEFAGHDPYQVDWGVGGDKEHNLYHQYIATEVTEDEIIIKIYGDVSGVWLNANGTSPGTSINNKIAEIKLSNTITSLGGISNAYNDGCCCVDKLTIPTSVITISGSAFNSYHRDLLLESEEDSQLKSIEVGAFQNSKISNINLPYGLEEIGDSAFTGMPNLERIVIPKSVKLIGIDAFKDSSSLSIVDLNNYDNPYILPETSVSSFESCSSALKFYVKNEEMYNAFTTKSALKDFKSQFVIGPAPSLN